MAIAQNETPATPGSKTSDSLGEPSTEHIYGPKDGAKSPKLTYSCAPEYPKRARSSHIEGVVVLSLVVGSNGVLREVVVARSLSPDLDEAAIDTVKKWKFAPGTKDGRPVACRISIEIQFKRF